MGPTNVALVKLYQADQALREAQGRLEAVSKNVRLQDRRLADISERLRLAQTRLRENQSAGAQLDLDIKSRDERIERLRTQQQTAKTNREYQTFLVEINTEKVDKTKVEEQSLASMEQVEILAKEVNELTAQQVTEKEKLQQLQSQINDQVRTIQTELDRLTPIRQAAADNVPPRLRDAFDRMADRYEGEALSALSKPDRRREEYICTSCHMDLVADIYNKLHTRDDLVNCPSCGRFLYIPDDLPPETAVNTKPRKAKKEEASSPT